MPRDQDRHGERTHSNTRRRFLEATAATSVAASLAGIGTAAAQENASDYVTWECDHVALTNTGDLKNARVDFQDGSHVQSMNGVDGEEPVRLGSPGRTADTATITFQDGTETTLENPSPDCDRRHRATTFTATAVHVPRVEFVFNSSIPVSLTTRVVLHFADGSSQAKQSYMDDGRGGLNEFDVPGVDIRDGMDVVPNLYRGTGAHSGKVVEAIEVNTDQDYRTHYLKNPSAQACQHGTETAQERIIEIVGTSKGAVRYEFTATGPIRPVGLNEKIKIERPDAISQNRDGTWTVTGLTGKTGFGDSYAVNGEITDFTKKGGDGDYVVRALERRQLDY